MKPAIEKYKMVRRGQQWCVRVNGTVNTTDSWHWCRKRNMSYYKIKQRWKSHFYLNDSHWDYDFLFDKREEALMFILGYL